MTSIRRTLLVWLLLGLAAVAVLASVATYFDTRREIGELFDLQLKQLAYSTRIDDLLRGRQPSVPAPARTAPRACPRSSRRSGTATACSSTTRARAPACPCRRPKATATSSADGRAWRVYTHVEGRHALQVAHALDERREIAAQSALRTLLPLAALIPFLGVLIWYAVGRGLRPLETMSPRGGQAPARRHGAAGRNRTAARSCGRWPAASTRCSRASTTRSTRSAASLPTPRTNCARRSPR